MLAPLVASYIEGSTPIEPSVPNGVARRNDTENILWVTKFQKR